MKKRRLQEVVKVLREEITDEQFNIEFYMNPCQTVGCALGHYILKRPKCGLTLRMDFKLYTVKPYVASGHFGISLLEFVELFTLAGYEDFRPSRLQVAERIENFIATGK